MLSERRDCERSGVQGANERDRAQKQLNHLLVRTGAISHNSSEQRERERDAMRGNENRPVARDEMRMRRNFVYKGDAYADELCNLMLKKIAHSGEQFSRRLFLLFPLRLVLCDCMLLEASFLSCTETTSRTSCV